MNECLDLSTSGCCWLNRRLPTDVPGNSFHDAASVRGRLHVAEALSSTGNVPGCQLLTGSLCGSKSETAAHTAFSLSLSLIHMQTDTQMVATHTHKTVMISYFPFKIVYPFLDTFTHWTSHFLSSLRVTLSTVQTNPRHPGFYGALWPHITFMSDIWQ